MIAKKPPAGSGRLRGGTLVRRIVPLVMRAKRGMTLGIRGVVLDGENRVLLVRHGYAEGWHFPGGGIEPGETALLSLEREMLEETGTIIEGKPALHGFFFNPRFGGRDHIAVYVIRAFSRPVVPAPNREIAEQGFFARNGLPEGTTPATTRRLAEILDGAPVDPIW